MVTRIQTLEKTEGAIKNSDLEPLAILSTQDTGRRQTKYKNTTQKLKKMSNMDPTKKTCVREGKAVPASYKTLAMLLIQSRRVRHHYAQANTNKTNKTSTLSIFMYYMTLRKL